MSFDIEQFYFMESDNKIARARKMTCTITGSEICTIDIKIQDKSLPKDSCTEITTHISKCQFEALEKHAIYPPIKKVRFIPKYQAAKYEKVYDFFTNPEFSGTLYELVMEVENKSVDPEVFSNANWHEEGVVSEVTQNKSFSNYRMSMSLAK